MSFGIIIKNTDGDMLVDSKFLNYSLATSGVTVCGVGVTDIKFSFLITSNSPPVICASQWTGGGKIGGVTAIGVPGAWSGFSVRVRTAVISLQWQVYATDLPSGEQWTLSVFNEGGNKVFDAGRRMLTFSGEVSGKTTDWMRVGGSPYVNGRDDLYHYKFSSVQNGQYVAIGILPYSFFGVVNTNRGQVSVVTEVGLGWASSGVPSLYLESFMDAPSGMFPSGIPGAVFYDLPAMPILNI
ncbi:hypothetical protein [Pseudomonas sp. PH1b]|uniref:hypothetical protein n=1 Tax=Pseudomonas sp. PH1b TaxID=1397282 RepID=UPI0012FF40F9|nr:hypothetical protein [Pseudomonas sp. PH1b]